MIQKKISPNNTLWIRDWEKIHPWSRMVKKHRMYATPIHFVGAAYWIHANKINIGQQCHWQPLASGVNYTGTTVQGVDTTAHHCPGSSIGTTDPVMQ
jgi:hypothetical protein